MAFSLVANVSRAGTGTTGSINTSGASLLVALVTRTTTAVTLTDSKSNTWSLLRTQTGGGSAAIDLYVAVNPIVGSSHTFTVASGFPCVFVAAFSGGSAVDVGIVPANNSGSANNLQAGSIQANYPNPLLLASVAYRDTTTISVDSGFTITNQQPFLTGTQVGGALAYLIQSGSSSSVNPKFSWTTASACAAANVSAVFGSGGGVTVVEVGYPFGG